MLIQFTMKCQSCVIHKSADCGMTLYQVLKLWGTEHKLWGTEHIALVFSMTHKPFS